MSYHNKFYGPFDEETKWRRKRDHYRSVFQVDRDRVIHSYAFRRLQAKTQVFKPGEYDFYRTRLTHTIEVAQIGRSICSLLRKKGGALKDDFYIDHDLVEAICLAHDIGHPPFGHAGERALNQLMSDFGGFEANAQTVRLLTERIWAGTAPGERIGLNPSRALLDGVLKYKKVRSDVKGPNHFLYDEQDRYLEFVHSGCELRDREPKSIECQIMDWADDVAYSVGDLVDGVRARFITIEKLKNWHSSKKDASMVDELILALKKRSLSRFAAERIGNFVEACSLRKEKDTVGLSEKSNRYAYGLKIPEARRKEQECLKAISYDLVFASPAVQQLEYKAQRMLNGLFLILKDHYVCPGGGKQHLLNEDVECELVRALNVNHRARLLCDHISDMSDDYVSRTYRRLIDPEFGSIVDLV
jgi:dGTPase